MCGRYVSPAQAEMERYWAYSGRGNQLGFVQHGNIAPSTQIPIIYPGDEGLERCGWAAGGRRRRRSAREDAGAAAKGL
jgi:putative SOS response-associated peptidase YedK